MSKSRKVLKKSIHAFAWWKDFVEVIFKISGYLFNVGCEMEQTNQYHLAALNLEIWVWFAHYLQNGYECKESLIAIFTYKIFQSEINWHERATSSGLENLSD